MRTPGSGPSRVRIQLEHMSTSWFGALPVTGGTRFRLWASSARTASVVLHDGAAAGTHLLGRGDDGMFDRIVDGAAPGDRYSYVVDGRPPQPDPASRCQPDGVHGPSAIVDPFGFEWSDRTWRGRRADDLVIYELHIGTFSPEGTFAGAAERLVYLRDLGVTAIELMPVAAAAGTRNWGYDGVCLYAPSAAYGTPDDLRRLVDRAHQFGLAVLLDVVYNHLGPEGAYLPQISPDYVTDRHETPWGRAINLEGPGSAMVRRFILENAVHWIREYHMDGLRLDATHALYDHDTSHIVREIARAAHEAVPRTVVVHAEDHRNLAAMIEDAAEGGWAVDGLWADDFHHIVRRLLAGDAHGYYRDFEGTTGELAAVYRQGWLYTGQHSAHEGRARGSDPSRVPMYRFVICLQNHDQIGNRAHGERLNHQISADAYRAATVLLLTAPMTPLLFMGQEWSADSPFLYFTDLEPALGALVTAGRRNEFSAFPEFVEPDARERIPDPQAQSTFEKSRLDWTETARPPHAAVLRLYRTLLALRLEHAALGASSGTAGEAVAVDGETLVVRRAADGAEFVVVVRLRGAGRLDLSTLTILDDAGRGRWEAILTTEDPLFVEAPVPVAVDLTSMGPAVAFARPGAVVLRRTR